MMATRIESFNLGNTCKLNVSALLVSITTQSHNSSDWSWTLPSQAWPVFALGFAFQPLTGHLKAVLSSRWVFFGAVRQRKTAGLKKVPKPPPNFWVKPSCNLCLFPENSPNKTPELNQGWCRRAVLMCSVFVVDIGNGSFFFFFQTFFLHYQVKWKCFKG